MLINREAVLKNFELKEGDNYFYCECCGEKNRDGNGCKFIRVRSNKLIYGCTTRLVCNECLLEIHKNDEILYAGGSDLYDIKFSKVNSFRIEYEKECAVPKEVYGDVKEFTYMWFIWKIDEVEYKTYFSPMILNDDVFDVYVNGLTIYKSIHELPLEITREYGKLIRQYRKEYKRYSKYISGVIGG